MANELNKQDLPLLKKAYDKAVAEGKTIFTFKGIELLTGYAKYVIEMWEEQK